MKNLVNLGKSRSVFVWLNTTLINKINEKLSLNISSVMNPEDIENANGIYFGQHSSVIATSAFTKYFVIKKKEVQRNIPSFQQEQYREVLRSKSNLSLF